MTQKEYTAMKRRLLAGRLVEFSWNGEQYLIQEENNKGWDYLGLWRTSGRPECLGRALFDIFDGISEEEVLTILHCPCISGRSVSELVQEIQLRL